MKTLVKNDKNQCLFILLYVCNSFKIFLQIVTNIFLESYDFLVLEGDREMELREFLCFYRVMGAS